MPKIKIDISKYRNPEYNVNSIFVNRWSPRAMSGEEISNDELMSLFEAARWAPSSYNNQSWRFLYAIKNTENWDLFFDLLTEPNQVWAKNAAVLVVIISKDTFDYNNKPSRTHSFDTGLAWENLALQGSIMGLIVHGMQGFDYEEAKKKLDIPDGYTVEAMAAIGKPGKKEDLPKELQEREFPSDRKKISEIAFEGKFRM
jgi:nitroreductase